MILRRALRKKMSNLALERWQEVSRRKGRDVRTCSDFSKWKVVCVGREHGCLYTLLGLFLGLQMQQLIKNLRFSEGNAAWGNSMCVFGSFSLG